MEVHIDIYMLANDTKILKEFQGKDSIEKALEFLNALRLKVKA